jgi:hypothetical protein
MRSESYDSTNSGELPTTDHPSSSVFDKIYSGYEEYLELSDSMESMHIGDIEEDGSADWETVHSGDDQEMGDEESDIGEEPPFDLFYDMNAYHANQGYPIDAPYSHQPVNWQEDGIVYTGFVPQHLVEQAAAFFGQQQDDFQQDFDSYEGFQDFAGLFPQAPVVDSCSPETLVFTSSPSQGAGAGEKAAPLIIETWQVKDVDYLQPGSSLPFGLISEILDYHPGVAYPSARTHSQSRSHFQAQTDTDDNIGLCIYNGRVYKAMRPLRATESALWDVRPRSAMDRRKGCWRRLRERGSGEDGERGYQLSSA